MLTTKVVSRIEEIPVQDWESVFPKVTENYYLFKSLDESHLEQFSFYYIIAYDNAIAVAATSCFLMRFPFDMTVHGPLKTFLSFIKKLMPNILCPKVLICGLPMGQGRIGIAKDCPGAMEAICAGMEKIAKEQKAEMFLYKDFNATYDALFSPLLKKGFSRVESLPSTDMAITFSSFDDYLKKLSQTSRENLKRKLKKADSQVKIDLEVTDTLSDELLPDVYGLYLQTFDKQDMGLEKLTMDFFRRTSANMPQQVKYFLWRIEGKLVAFAFCLISGDHFIDYYLGFEYAVAYQYNLYFIRFRDLLKWCIAHGIKSYEMGVTTYEPKRRLGFDFIRLYFYIKHRNPLINPFIKVISHFVKPENFDPVFKEMNNGSPLTVSSAAS